MDVGLGRWRRGGRGVVLHEQIVAAPIHLMREIETPSGTARVLMQHALDPRAALVLGHGAGGSVSAPDLQVAARVALEEEISVVLVEQPYRVAGKSNAPAAPKLDEAWLAVVEALDLG